MNVDPESVTSTVSKRIAESVAAEHIAGRGIDGEPRPSGADCANRFIVRFQHSRIDFPDPIRRRTQEHGARQVGAV